MGKEHACSAEDAGRCESDPWVGKVLEEGMAIQSSLFAWRIHGQKSLVGTVRRVAKSQT